MKIIVKIIFILNPMKKDKLIKFLNYNPYDFKFSQLQNFFNFLSLILFYGSIIFILIFIFFLRNKKNPT